MPTLTWACALSAQGKHDEAIAELNTAVRLKPDDAAAHAALASALADRGKLVNAVAEYRAAVRLEPDDADAHRRLGYTLATQGKLEEAITEYKNAIRLNPKHALAHTNLGYALLSQDKVDEAAAEYREAVRLEPHDYNSHNNLGAVLCDKKHDFDGAIAEFREAIRLEPRDPDAYHNLGVALLGQGKQEPAIAAFRQAVRLKPDYLDAREKLGNALRAQGKFEDAIAEFKEIVRQKPDYAGARHNLAHVLSVIGRSHDAAIEFREVIRLMPDLAEAYFDLAKVLQEQLDYAGALAMYRKGHEVGTKQPNWQYPSAQWVADAERAVALAPRLLTVIRNEDRPRNTAEALAFAQMAYDRKSFAGAARLWAGALQADPKLGEDRDAGHRYNAACAAALAAAGKSRDEAPLSDADRAKLRTQALDWLKAEHHAWAKLLETGKPDARATVIEKLDHWHEDSDLASVRDADGLANLTEPERTAWRGLWQDVDSLLQKARGVSR